MDNTLRMMNPSCREDFTSTNVFSSNRLASNTSLLRKIGMLISAHRRSTKAKLARRVFGTVRRRLLRIHMARTEPLPTNAVTVMPTTRVDINDLVVRDFVSNMWLGVFWLNLLCNDQKNASISPSFVSIIKNVFLSYTEMFPVPSGKRISASTYV